MKVLRNTPVILSFVFLICAFAIVSAGWLFFDRAKKEVKHSAHDDLTIIANMKISQIIAWRKERIGDAEVICHDPLNTCRIMPFLEHSSPEDRGEDIRSWMESFRIGYRYSSLVLLDTMCRKRLSVGFTEKEFDALDQSIIKAVIQSGKPLLSDFHRDEPMRSVYLNLYVPLLASKDESETKTCIGIMLLEIDPDIFLYPLIRSWPTPSATAETILARREGNEVVYLNELRHRKDTPMDIRFSLTDYTRTAVMAALGKEGMVEGIDYRGIKVLAVLRCVPESTWIMITKQDYDEIMAPFHAQALNIGYFTGGAILVIGLTILLWGKRREAEFYRRQYEAKYALQQSENQVRLLLDSTAEAIFGIDLQGNCTLCNPACLRLLGYKSPDELIGKNTHFRLHNKKPDGSPFPIEECKIFQVLQKGEGSHVDNEVFWRADGTCFPVEYWSYPQRRDGAIVGVVVAFLDITERRDTARELYKAKEAAEAASRAKSTFLANMSHEIRTPLNAVLGFSQLMLRDPLLSSRQKEYLHTINRSGEHLLTLINGILEISKIEAGHVVLNPTTFDLYTLLDDLFMMFRVRTEAKKLGFFLKRTENIPRYIVADEGKLRQVLINLIGNAVKFTEKGTIWLRVDVIQKFEAGLRLASEVEDTGPGIPESEMSNLFRPFEQTLVGRLAGTGSGLGLAISRDFVRLMGGDITIKSQVGKGSIFRFEIDIKEGTDIEVMHRERTSKHVIRLEQTEEPVRILVVDDKEENRTFVSQILNIVGFETQEAINGVETVEKFVRWSPHLILLDMCMPVMDGYEAARRIKSMEKGKNTAIIAITASAFEEDRQEMLNIGVDGYIRKPLRESELFEAIRKCLDVKYVYAEEEATYRTSQPSVDSSVLTRVALSELPPELVEEMYQATIKADLDSLLGLIAQVALHNDHISKKLKGLAEKYEYEKLLELLKKCEEKK